MPIEKPFFTIGLADGGIAAKGTSNNSYLENGNSITCTWDIGEISYSYASTVPSVDKSYCEGEISITIPK